MKVVKVYTRGCFVVRLVLIDLEFKKMGKNLTWYKLILPLQENMWDKLKGAFG